MTHSFDPIESFAGLWDFAYKTAPVYAKHITAVIADSSFFNDLLKLKTLEGDSSLKAGSMVCRGAKGEYWPQSATRVIAKYDLKAIDVDGWMEFVPKRVAVQYMKIAAVRSGMTTFTIATKWGTPDGEGGFYQTGNVGDYVLCDAGECWIVAADVFESTYTQLDTP